MIYGPKSTESSRQATPTLNRLNSRPSRLRSTMASHRQSRTSATGMSGRPEQPVTNLAVGPPREQPSNLCWAGLAGNGWACTESGSQPLVARKPGRRQGGGTRGYIRWTADAIWIPGPPPLGDLGRASGRGRRCGRPDHLVRRRRFRRWWHLLAHGRRGVRRLLTGPNLDSAGGRGESAVGYQPRSPASLLSPVRARPREGRVG